MSETAGQVQLDLTLLNKNFQTQLTKSVNGAISKTQSAVKSSLNGMAASVAKLAVAGIAIKKSFDFLKECNEEYADDITQMGKLAVVMKQRMGATEDMVNAIYDLTNAQQALGVIDNSAQNAGAQQLATFLNTTDSLKTLIPAMNNLAAQQNGVNATSGDLVNIGNLMGKVMQGQTSALTRVGITFTSAQEQMLKYGNEEQRAAMLAQVITDNVGQMNAALANTPAGQIAQLRNNFGELKKELGTFVSNVITPVIRALNVLIGYVTKAAMAINALFGFKKTNAAALGTVSGGLSGISDAAEEAGDSTAAAAKKINKSLTSFDQLNKLSDNSDSGSGGGGGGGAGGVDVGDIVSVDPSAAADNVVSEFMQKLSDAIKAGDWRGVGQILAEKTNEIVDKIPWKETGRKVGNAINGVVDLVDGYVQSGHVLGTWQKIGNGVAQHLNEAFATIKWQTVGAMLTDGLKVALDMLHGFVTGDGAFNFVAFGQDVGTMIMGAIQNIEWAQAASDMSTLAIGILNAITQALRTVDWSYVYSTILDMLMAIDWVGLLSSLAEAICAAWPIIIPIIVISAVKLLTTMLLAELGKVLMTGISGWLTGTLIPAITTGVGNLLFTIQFHLWEFGTWLTGTLFPAIVGAVQGAIAFIIANPIVLIIAAIVALVALIALKGDEIQGLLNKLDGFLQNVFAVDWTNVFGPVLGGVMNGFLQICKGIWDGLRQMLNGLIDFIRGVFTGNWTRAWNGVVEAFGGAFKMIEACAKAPLNGLITLFNGAINAINSAIGGLNKIKINIPDWVPGIGGKGLGFNIPSLGNIPMLADGGYVERNSPQLAMIGDNKKHGEIVTPEDKLTAAVQAETAPLYSLLSQMISMMQNNNNQPAGDIVIPVTIGGEKIDTILVKANNRRALRTGGQ